MRFLVARKQLVNCILLISVTICLIGCRERGGSGSRRDDTRNPDAQAHYLKGLIVQTLKPLPAMKRDLAIQSLDVLRREIAKFSKEQLGPHFETIQAIDKESEELMKLLQDGGSPSDVSSRVKTILEKAALLPGEVEESTSS
ncbi:MAG: hypothetical protein QXT77_07640 [Candidatus Methanomethylicaceae archaeon]